MATTKRMVTSSATKVAVSTVKVTATDLKKIERCIVMTDEVNELLKKFKDGVVINGIPKNELYMKVKEMTKSQKAFAKIVDAVSIK